MSEFKKGDVVQLKSGGPKMKVLELSGGEVWCVWCYGSAKMTDSFIAELLVKAAPEALSSPGTN